MSEVVPTHWDSSGLDRVKHLCLEISDLVYDPNIGTIWSTFVKIWDPVIPMVQTMEAPKLRQVATAISDAANIMLNWTSSQSPKANPVGVGAGSLIYETLVEYAKIIRLISETIEHDASYYRVERRLYGEDSALFDFEKLVANAIVDETRLSTNAMTIVQLDDRLNSFDSWNNPESAKKLEPLSIVLSHYIDWLAKAHADAKN